ncbi:hypothetical protein GCM10009765_38500 [Fodinicola feengrottensis]|uniref:DUF4383 domain-containing protein n=1 Tax=Fodinicola feengrottensis TaxID=435914 RepID=A0ABN2HCD8_9ACTN
MPTGVGTTDGIVRGLTAAGVLMSADVHLALYFGGFGSIPVIGLLFMVNAIAGLLIGVGVVAVRHWVVAFLALGFSVATLAGFYLSVAVGLFGFRETLTGTQQVMAEVAEIVGLIGAAVLLGTQWRRSRALVRA